MDLRITIKGRFVLIKIQRDKYIELFRKGKIYANCLNYFREKEDNVIGDEQEGVLNGCNGGKYYIPQLQEVGEFSENDGFRTLHSNDYVFCMFSINIESGAFSFSKEQKENLSTFGDTALVITDAEEFFRRVCVALKKQNIDGTCGCVEYYTDNDCFSRIQSIVKDISNHVFWKNSNYRYQQEFRMIFFNKNKQEDHIELDIGDISDISVIMSIEKLLSFQVNVKQACLQY